MSPLGTRYAVRHHRFCWGRVPISHSVCCQRPNAALLKLPALGRPVRRSPVPPSCACRCLAADLSRHLRRSVAPVRAGCPARRGTNSHQAPLKTWEVGQGSRHRSVWSAAWHVFLSVACRRGLMTSFEISHLHFPLSLVESCAHKSSCLIY